MGCFREDQMFQGVLRGIPCSLGPWTYAGLAASETNVNLDVTPSTAERLAVRFAEITGLAVRASQPVTAGTATFEVCIDDVPTGLTVTLDSVDHPSTNVVERTSRATPINLSAGSAVSIIATTSSDFAPAVDILAEITEVLTDTGYPPR